MRDGKRVPAHEGWRDARSALVVAQNGPPQAGANTWTDSAVHQRDATHVTHRNSVAPLTIIPTLRLCQLEAESETDQDDFFSRRFLLARRFDFASSSHASAQSPEDVFLH